MTTLADRAKAAASYPIRWLLDVTKPPPRARPEHLRFFGRPAVGRVRRRRRREEES